MSEAAKIAGKEADEWLIKALTMATLLVIPEDNVANMKTTHDHPSTGKREGENERRRMTVAKVYTLIGRRVMSTLFDTGASPSVLHLDMWQEVSRQNPHILWRLADTVMSLSIPNSTRLPIVDVVSLPVTVVG